MRACCCTIHNFIWMATRNDCWFTQFNVDDLIVDGEGRNKSGNLSHSIDLTDQVAEAVVTYQDQLVELMLANNMHS